jgi:hypothetical protein
MRENRSGILLLAFLLVGFALALSNCGSGGGTVTLAELTADNATQVAGSMDQVMSLIGPASSLGGMEVAATSQRPPLIRIIDTMKAVSGRHLPDSRLSAQAGMTEDIPCDSGSGTVSADWDGSDIITDPFEVLNLKVTMHFEDCTMEDETLDGSATMKYTGTLGDPERITVSTSSLNFKKTGLPEGDTDITMTDFSMDVTGDATGGTMDITGKITGTAEGTPVDAEFDGLVLAMEVVSGGEELSITGRVRSSCIGGWLAFSTPTPVFVATGEDCPSAGEVAVNSGDNTVSIVVGPGTAEIKIYYNGAEVASYPDCEGVEGICS